MHYSYQGSSESPPKDLQKPVLLTQFSNESHDAQFQALIQSRFNSAMEILEAEDPRERSEQDKNMLAEIDKLSQEIDRIPALISDADAVSDALVGFKSRRQALQESLNAEQREKQARFTKNKNLLNWVASECGFKMPSSGSPSSAVKNSGH